MLVCCGVVAVGLCGTALSPAKKLIGNLATGPYAALVGNQIPTPVRYQFVFFVFEMKHLSSGLIVLYDIARPYVDSVSAQ